MAKLARSNPAGMHKPFSNYSHVVTAEGAQRLVFCAGQVAADGQGNVLPPDDFEAQARAQACWERPTWRLGSWQSARLDTAMAGFAEAFGIEEDAEAGDNRSRRRQEQPQGAATDDKALAVLGLAPTATRAEIKARYKRLVKRYHPDANGGDRQAEERLKVINQAYSTLRKRPVAV